MGRGTEREGGWEDSQNRLLLKVKCLRMEGEGESGKREREREREMWNCLVLSRSKVG